MTKKVKKNKKIPFVILSAIAFCFTLMFGVLFTSTPVFAYSETPSSVTSSTNLNFAYNGNTTSIYTNPTGWTKGLPNNTTSGVINLQHFNSETFKLTVDQKPSKIQGTDDYVLMLNPKTDSSSLPTSQYYANSSNFTLSAYSHYKIKVYTKVNENANSSIYVTGLDKELSFEKINYDDAREWRDYTFYISTGIDQQEIKLELWLGSKESVSAGAVFFDNIEFTQVSENEINTSKSRTKHINLDKSALVTDINANFENNTLADWSRINEMKVDTFAEIINLSNNNESVAKDITYVGTDLSKNNERAFVLYTKNDTKSYIGYKSKNIALKMYDIVKVTIRAKTADLNGSARIVLTENDILDSNGKKIDSITPNTQTITISSNSSNKFTNDYSTYTFYLKGRSLYNTSYNLELWLGSKESPASGLVAFDNIKLEEVSYSDYTNASTDSSTVKIAFDTDPKNFIISNSAFNDVRKESKSLTYPLTPANWTQTAKDKKDCDFGVINTNDEVYAKYNRFANPGNPSGFGSTSTDTNNVLLMYNTTKTYQSVKSSSFSIDANSYYKLSFDYKMFATNNKLDSELNLDIFNVYIQDENNNILYANENISANNDNLWKKYTIYFNTKAYSNTLNLILSLGKENDEVSGIAFIDNVILVKDEKMTNETYEQIAKTNNVLDFEQGNFNLVKYDKNGIYTPLRYTENLENADEVSSGLKPGYGGIIDADDELNAIEKSPNHTSALSYLMKISTLNKATYSLTAKDSLSLSSDTYHKFTIDILTKGIKKDLDYDKSYGAVFALSGLDENISGIVSDNEWTTYTIYVASTSSVSINIKFALESLDLTTSGDAYFDNFTYEKIDKDTYNLAKLNSSDNKTNLFIGNTDTKDDDNTDVNKANLDYIWYVIPTLLLAVALIIALVAYLMKKVNIKKWEKRKINEYDRDKTVHRDVIRAEAEKRRDAEVKELKTTITDLEAQRTHIEEVHQEQLKASRVNRAKGVTRSEEKEFKQYAKLHTAIENRIANINKQIDKLNTAEYLLSVQHKIMLEKAKAERLAKENAYEKDKKEKKIVKTKKRK